MIQWLLLDYGETISTRLPASTVNDLAALVGLQQDEFLHRYWQARPAYDLGEPAAIYWSRVLHRDPDELAPVVDRLTRIDVEGWLHVNSLTLRTLLTHARQNGARLALLSNAPEPLAAAIERCYWARHFTQRFFSCRLRCAKPDPAAFTTVLAHLDANPRDVLFVDDNAANTLAAAALGMSTITFSLASALGRELRLTGAPPAKVEAPNRRYSSPRGRPVGHPPEVRHPAAGRQVRAAALQNDHSRTT